MIDRAVAALPFCYVTTTGRVTGRPHRIEIWFAAAEAAGRDTIYLLAGGRARSDWVRNLVSSPSCTVEIGAETYSGYGRVVDGTAEEEPARRLVYEKYRRADDLETWRNEALPVAIDLNP
ncbi:MAG: nitroreductase/quinone reductase family protein [Acidimicrobiia bacterium]